eukprot:Pgem_evm1s7816
MFRIVSIATVAIATVSAAVVPAPAELKTVYYSDHPKVLAMISDRNGNCLIRDQGDIALEKCDMNLQTHKWNVTHDAGDADTKTLFKIPYTDDYHYDMCLDLELTTTPNKTDPQGYPVEKTYPYMKPCNKYDSQSFFVQTLAGNHEGQATYYIQSMVDSNNVDYMWYCLRSDPDNQFGVRFELCAPEENKLSMYKWDIQLLL